MDPASGRRWMTRGQLSHEFYEHAMSVPAEDWREWGGSEQGRSLVASQLSSLGIAKEAAWKLIESADADPSWRGLASLDAAARAVRSMVDAGACKRRPGSRRAPDDIIKRRLLDPKRLLVRAGRGRQRGRDPRRGLYCGRPATTKRRRHPRKARKARTPTNPRIIVQSSRSGARRSPSSARTRAVAADPRGWSPHALQP